MVTAVVTVSPNLTAYLSCSYYCQGSNRGLGLGFIRQLLLRPQYTRIVAAARSVDKKGELSRLVDESEGRVGVVKLGEISDVDSCQVSLLYCDGGK